MVKETHSKVLQKTSKVLLCLLVVSLVWLVKVVIVKVLASSFHDKKFFARAKTYLFKQYVIKKLCEHPKLEEESKRDDKLKGKTEERNFLRSFRVFSKKLDKIRSDSQINKKKGSAPSPQEVDKRSSEWVLIDCDPRQVSA